MKPSINMTFKGEEESHASKIFIIDFVRFKKFKKIRNVLSYGCFILAIKLQLRQVIKRLTGINNLPRDRLEKHPESMI